MASWPTQAWAWRGPNNTDYKGKTAGTKEEFVKPNGLYFQVGEVVALVKTLTGSTTFSQVEQ